MHRFKSAILAIFQFFQNGILNWCMKFENFFDQKYSFEALWKCQLEKNIHNMPRIRQIQDLCRKKYKKGIS